jgi:hypothetical protein
MKDKNTKIFNRYWLWNSHILYVQCANFSDIRVGAVQLLKKVDLVARCQSF